MIQNYIEILITIKKYMLLIPIKKVVDFTNTIIGKYDENGDFQHRLKQPYRRDKNTSKFLKINCIKAVGNWNLDLIFQNGFNALFSNTHGGKSTIINLIFKILCISESLSTDDCIKNVNYCLMEFQLNAKKYTIKCSFRPTTIHLSKKWNIDTFDMEPSERKFIPDIRNIIEREFNLIDHNKKNKITLNSIQQCYRSFYLIQDTINEILAGNSDTRTAILRFLLRQPDQSNQFPDVNTELNVLKNKNKNEIDKINTELKLKLKKLEVDANHTRIIL